MKLSEIINKYGDCEVKSELIDLIDVKPKTIYGLKKGDEYYCMNSIGKIENGVFYDCIFSNARLIIGNIFLTKHEAEIYLEKLKVESILRKHSYNFSKEEWNDGNMNKYYVVYSVKKNITDFQFSRYVKTQGTLYFKSFEDYKNAIDEVGEQRLINYFKGVL